MVVLDEAYVEFYGQSMASSVATHANLIVLRTFSKWAGLAGLRVGYGILPTWIIEQLWKIKQPYNVNVAAAAAALASLEDADYLMANVQRIIEERERLFAALQNFDFLEPYPSKTNFILNRVVGREALGIKLALEQRGVLIRYYDSPGLDDHIRVSVGRPVHSDALLSALAEIGGAP